MKRQLMLKTVFAPSDFMGCLASNYSKMKLIKIAKEIEENKQDNSFSRKLNLKQIREWKKSIFMKIK